MGLPIERHGHPLDRLRCRGDGPAHHLRPPHGNPRVSVTVSWLPPHGRTTLVEYFVTDGLVPPRPASSKGPIDIVRVVVRQMAPGARRVRTVAKPGVDPPAGGRYQRA